MCFPSRNFPRRQFFSRLIREQAGKLEIDGVQAIQFWMEPSSLSVRLSAPPCDGNGEDCPLSFPTDHRPAFRSGTGANLSGTAPHNFSGDQFAPSHPSRNNRFRSIAFWLIAGLGTLAFSKTLQADKPTGFKTPPQANAPASPARTISWKHWEPASFEQARRENKLVFLFVGSARSQRSRQMLQQTLTQAEIVSRLNAQFVCIQVDADDEPEIARTYQLALQVSYELAKAAGTFNEPLATFLTPDRKLIAGGGYFSPLDTPAARGFLPALNQIQTAWSTREADVRATADRIFSQLSRRVEPQNRPADPVPDPAWISAAQSHYAASFDPQSGGFAFVPAESSPKHPLGCAPLFWMQAQIGRTDAPAELQQQLDLTLEKMMQGEISDQLAGGFFRQATRADWSQPDFEKRLCDQALMAQIFVDAYRRSSRESDRATAISILDFVLQDLTAPHGGFYSGMAAPSTTTGPHYYLWTIAELEKVLNPNEFRLVSAVYGLQQADSKQTERALAVISPIADVSQELALPVKELHLRLDEIRRKLLTVRKRRPAPARDERVLTGWNGLMIRTLAQAGKSLQNRDYLAAAERSALRVLSAHRDSTGRLLRAAAQGKTEVPAVLDDYAYFISGLLALHDATGEEKWLNAARRLMDDQIGIYWNQNQGGFYLNSNAQPTALIRLEIGEDLSLPSGNGISTLNLIQLSRMKSDESYRNSALKTLLAFAPQISQSPQDFCTLLLASQEYLHWFGAPRPASDGSGSLFTGGISNPRENTDAAPLNRASPRPASGLKEPEERRPRERNVPPATP